MSEITAAEREREYVEKMGRPLGRVFYHLWRRLSRSASEIERSRLTTLPANRRSRGQTGQLRKLGWTF